MNALLINAGIVFQIKMVPWQHGYNKVLTEKDVMIFIWLELRKEKNYLSELVTLNDWNIIYLY